MKKIIISFISGIIVMSFLSFINQNGEKDLSLARVQRASGKLVFMRCEPINDYDVVMEVEPFNFGGSKDTPEKIASFIVSRCLQKAKGNKKNPDIEFDGVVIGSTRKDIAIKFK